jgi:sodium-coupled neutral amino acid transporter 11
MEHGASRETKAEEGEGLINHAEREDSSDGDVPVHEADGVGEIGVGRPRIKMPPQRQSSFAQHRPDGTPRTPHRVRFEVAEPEAIREPNGHVAPPRSDAWLDDEDYMAAEDGRRSSTGQRAPLLTDIEAPSVTLANDMDLNPEDYLESARPKSGIKSAFMNMANSIIGAGIIGQPYAFKQAGLFSGIILLIALSVTVDWTIRLIVTNSKLSGANSFQATMEKCFGKSGLIAISIAQWAFAFGGMVAFCIIIGDTIPRVMASAFPSLATTPMLWLLTDRRAVIVLVVLGLSYPLSLYRDIAMVGQGKFILFNSADGSTPACESIHPRLNQHDDHHPHRGHPRANTASEPPRPVEG